MTKPTLTADQLETLRKRLPRGTTVYTVLTHVSSTGMSRRLKLMIPVIYLEKDYSKGKAEGDKIVYPTHKVNRITDITWLVARLLGYKINDRHELTVSGCGMDMGFHVVYELASALFTDDRNKKNYGHGNSQLGGYALSHKWL